MNEKQIELKTKIKLLQQELCDLQSNCEHTKVVYTYGANSWNYCPQDDTYWVDIECISCGSKFSAYSDSETYKFKGIIGSSLKIKREDFEYVVKNRDIIEELLKEI